MILSFENLEQHNHQIFKSSHHQIKKAMAEEKSGPNWSLIIGGLLTAAAIAYLLYSMMNSTTTVDMGSGAH